MKKKKAVIIAGSVAGMLAALVLTMKIMSGRTYDRSNPRSLKNSYYYTCSVEVNVPAEKVFEFITCRNRDVWNNVAEEHAGQTNEIINSDRLEEGTVMICEEFTEDEGVSHRYVVKKVIPNRLVYYASEPSRVFFADKSGNMKEVTTCNTHVYFDVEELASDTTKISQTLVIQMPNFIVKFLSDVAGGKEGDQTWGNHLKSELEGLADYIVLDYENT